MKILKFIAAISVPFRIYLYGILLVLFVISLDANLKPYIIKLLLDTLTGYYHGDITILVISYITLQFMMVGAWTFSDWCNTQYYVRFRCHIMNILINHTNKYSYSFFQNQLSGSTYSKINDISSSVPSIINTILYRFIHFILFIFISLFLLFKVNYIFFIATFLWVTIFLSYTAFMSKNFAKLNMIAAESRTKVWGNLADYLNNILNVKYFSSELYEKNRLNVGMRDYIQKHQQAGYSFTKFYAIQGIISSIYLIGCLLALVHNYTNNIITPGDFALVFSLITSIVRQLYDLSHQLREFVTAWSNVKQALTILDFPLDIQDQLNAQALLIKKGEIIFKDVSFNYQDGKALFYNKSLTINPKQKIGLVGYSGSGKSTFVNLILRLFDINSGAILIDGQDIRHVQQSSLRRNISLIPQDLILFHRSLMENIRYGKLDSTDEEVIEAAKKAQAHDFIMSLPNGYESFVGERGVKLSGGQRQRIAIARAFLKDSSILILDEATSHLDSITEAEIQNVLLELMKTKTTIIIAHRLSTLLYMDRILVFNEGKIIEDGTHQELLAKGRLYKKLWEAQVDGFLPEKYSQN